MKTYHKLELFIVFALGAVFLASALYLVDVQYKIRKAFVEHEREVAIGKRLMDDEAELLMKVRRASLTGPIMEAAAEMGLKGATGDNTVILVKESDGSIRLSKNTQRQLDEEESNQSKKEKKK